jgi:hypothetical protein
MGGGVRASRAGGRGRPDNWVPLDSRQKENEKEKGALGSFVDRKGALGREREREKEG